MFNIFGPHEIPDDLCRVGDLKNYLARFDEDVIVLERRINANYHCSSFSIRNFYPEVFSFMGGNGWEKGRLRNKRTAKGLLLT